MKAGKTPVRINFDTNLGFQYGFEYLFDYYGIIRHEGSKNVYLISLPASRFPGIADVVVNDIALGFPETTEKALSTKEIFLYNSIAFRIPKIWRSLTCPYVDFDMYILSPDDTVRCTNLSKLTQGITVTHIPECQMWEIPSSIEKTWKNPLPLKIVASSAIKHSAVADNFNLLITAFESDRCITFADMSQPQLLPLTNEMEYVIKTLK